MSSFLIWQSHCNSSSTILPHCTWSINLMSISRSKKMWERWTHSYSCEGPFVIQVTVVLITLPPKKQERKDEERRGCFSFGHQSRSGYTREQKVKLHEAPGKRKRGETWIKSAIQGGEGRKCEKVKDEQGKDAAGERERRPVMICQLFLSFSLPLFSSLSLFLSSVPFARRTLWFVSPAQFAVFIHCFFRIQGPIVNSAAYHACILVASLLQWNKICHPSHQLATLQFTRQLTPINCLTCVFAVATCYLQQIDVQTNNVKMVPEAKSSKNFPLSKLKTENCNNNNWIKREREREKEKVK